MCNLLAQTKAVVYIGVFLIEFKSQEDHDKNLGEVLARLQEAGMHVMKEKL